MNAAMLGTLSPVPHIDHKEFDRLIALNLVANQRLLSAFDPLLRKGASPRVVALTSGVAQAARPYWGGYAASNAALETLILTNGEEVKNLRDLRVALVAPGATATTMRARASPGDDTATGNGTGVVANGIPAYAASALTTRPQ